jgi:hypothetical protein
MMRSHRSVARLALVASLSIPLIALPPAIAQDAAAAAPASAVPAELQTAVENYWHYGKIARYDLQAAEAQKITAAGAEPAVVLAAFEKTAAGRNDDLNNWMLRWQGIPQSAESAKGLYQTLQQGRQSRRADQNYVESLIQRLGVNERAYILAVGQLRESGELAVPLMVSYLQNPQHAALHSPIRRALRDLGRTAINPLVAATEIKKDTDTLLTIIGVLADIGYDAPSPYLLRLAESKEHPASVAQAARGALLRLGTSQGQTATDAFFELAERVYYGRSALAVDLQAPVAYVWFWDDEKGLTKRDVPPAIFGPVMAMRHAEYAMKLGQSRGDALSLWLAADYKREALLPEGATDATRPENYPSAHYFGVSSGASHLYTTLDRAIKDNDAPVALRAIKSLREIVGAASLPQDAAAPLVAALRFPDRLVRYEAAFALAAANPPAAFTGSERVVPLLAEAVAQTGASNVVVLAQRSVEGDAELNKLIDGLKAAGIGAVGGATAQEAIGAATALPAVDAFVISDGVPQSEIDSLNALATGTARLERTPRIVIVGSGASRFVEQAATDPLLSTVPTPNAEAIKGQLEVARTKSGSLPLTDAVATEYALKSATLLQDLAGRTKAYDLLVAENTLAAALNDARPEIVKAVGHVLATLDSTRVQPALLEAAAGEKAADDVKMSLYRSLAAHAKQFGDRLNAQQHASLETAVADGQNLEVRAAAAEARGALNLPADQAKALIVQQSRT